MKINDHCFDKICSLQKWDKYSSGSWVKNTDPEGQLLPSAVDLQLISPTSECSRMQIVAFRLEHTGSSHLFANNSPAMHTAAIYKNLRICICKKEKRKEKKKKKDRYSHDSDF